MPHRSHNPHADKAGFVLPTVLVAVTVLAVAYLGCIEALGNLRKETLTLVQGAEMQRVGLIAEARWSYLAASEPFGPNALRIGAAQPGGGGASQVQTTNLLVDGTPYLWSEIGAPGNGSPYLVSIQDEGGLVNISRSSQDVLQRLFQQAGLGSGDAQTLAVDVVQRNLQPAPTLPLRRVQELFDLPDGQALLNDKARRAITALAVAEPDMAAANINTAPAAVLKIWFDFSDQQADQALVDRQLNTFTGLAQIGATSANRGANFSTTAGRYRLTLLDRKTGAVYRTTLTLTPRDIERPVWIEPAEPGLNPIPPQPQANVPQPFPAIPSSVS
jgi:hypothetical protein